MRMLEATQSITPGSCSASAMTCHIVSGLYLAAAPCISAAISSSGNVLTRPPLVVWVVDVCSGESSSPEEGGVVSLGGVSSTSASPAGDTAPDSTPADAAAAAVFLFFLSFSLTPPLSCRRAQRLRSHDATATNSAATSVAGPRFLLRSVSRAALCAARNPGWSLAARHPVDRRRPLRSSAQSAALRPAARTARRSPPRGCADGCWEAPHRVRGAGPIPLPRPTRREAPPPPGRTPMPPPGRTPAPAAGRSRSGGATTARPPAPGRGVPPRAHGAVRDVGAGRAPNPTDRAAAERLPPCVGEPPPRPPPLLRRPPPPSRAPPTRPTGRAPAPLRAPPKTPRSEERPRFERFRLRVARNTPPPTATAPGANSRPTGPPRTPTPPSRGSAPTRHPTAPGQPGTEPPPLPSPASPSSRRRWTDRRPQARPSP